eukprot:GGOE01003226.1.p1 GENE.GGOE01003226.1~~GGOE01003226.1.p1  ORF type:complete len:933 (-),score=213.85 GGOE01003226.1:60-2642(-)
MTTAELDGIASSSALRNQAFDVTGFLIFASPYFVQVLEGPPDAVAAMYSTISQDPRHTDRIVVMDVHPESRNFADWQLKMADMHLVSLPLIRELLTQLVMCFTGMWAYFPRDAAALLLQGRVPMEEIPRSLQLVVAFIHVSQYREMLQNESLRPRLPELLTAFADVCSTSIDASGGRVAKFVNGCCMAYWPRSQATQAVECIAAILRELAAVRGAHPEGDRPLRLLSATAGMHLGHALLCNAGTHKADFTLLGDCVNTAARISQLATKLRCAVLLTSEVVAAADISLAPQLETAGLHTVAGREHPVQCHRYRLAIPDVAALQAQIDRFRAAHTSPQPSPQRSGRHTLHLQTLGIAPTDDTWETGSHHCPPATPPGMVPSCPLLSPQSSARVRHASALQKGSPGPSNDTNLTSLTYISHMPQMGEEGLAWIQSSAIPWNTAHSITSSLMYLDGLVVQTMEGPQSSVSELWRRVQGDPRHRDLVVVLQTPLTRRRCTEVLAVEVVSDQTFEMFPAVRDIMAQLARSFVSLETYVPATVVRQLRAGADLRTIKPWSQDVVMLASDLCSFTTMSEAAPLQGLWHVCTVFIDLCSAAILEHGGEVVKLIGDCVVAHFPAAAAPAALEAAQAIVKGCQETRRAYHSALDFRSLLYCGVGLDSGSVVMAHTGSRLTRDFAVIGEVKMRVLELEALTRRSGRAIVASEALVAHLGGQLRGLKKLPSAFQVNGLAVYAMLGVDWTLNPTRIKRDIAALRHVDGAELERSLRRISSSLIHSKLFGREPSFAYGTRSPPRTPSCWPATADRQSPVSLLDAPFQPDVPLASCSLGAPDSFPPSPNFSATPPYAAKSKSPWARWLFCVPCRPT